MTKQPLNAVLSRAGIRLEDGALRQLEWLAAELLVWNQDRNLTAITDPDGVQIKHVLDSLTVVPVIAQLLPDRVGTLVDVGSGAGFPGLPIKIAMPWLDVSLVEATGKKVEFIRHAIDTLALVAVSAVQARAEAAAREPGLREHADLAVARAVGSVSALAELLIPFLRVGGKALLMKTAAAAGDELADAGKALDLLGARKVDTLDVGVPGLLDDRVLVVLEKVKPTDPRYPRRPGQPQRRPLGGRDLASA